MKIQNSNSIAKRICLNTPVFLFGALALLAAPLGASASNYTFTNVVAGTYDWTVPANWDANGVPVGATTNGVIFFGDVTTALGTPIVVNTDPTTLTVNSLTLNGLANDSSSTAVTLGSTANTWTLNGTTPTVNLNAMKNGGNNLTITFNPIIAFSQNVTFAGDGDATFVFASNIGSASKTLTKNGSSTMILNGGLSPWNGTTINGGTISVKGWYSAGTTTINSPGTLSFDTGGSTTHGSGTTTFKGNGTLKLATTTSFPAPGNSSYGMVTVAMSSGGLIWVSNNATFSASAYQKGVWTNNLASLQVDTGSTINFAEGGGYNGSTNGYLGASICQVDALSGSGTVKGGSVAPPNNTVLILGAAGGSGSFSGVIANSSTSPQLLTVQKAGAGTQTLMNANTYSGATIISSGTLQIGNATALGGTFTTTNGVNQYPVLVSSGAALDLNGQTFSNRIITLNGGSLVNNSGTPASLSGVSIGAVRRVVCTSGGTGVTAPATLSITGGGGSGATATASLGLTAASLSMTAGGGATTAFKVGDILTVTGGGGSGAQIKVLTLSGNAIATWALVSAGSGFTGAPTGTSGGSGSPQPTFSFNANNFAVVSTTVTAGGSGYTSQPTMTLSSGTGFAGQGLLDNHLHLMADSAVGGSGNTTISENILGSGGLTKTGAGTITLSGTNTYSGVTAISGGTLALGASGSLSNSSLNIGAGATLDVSSHATYNLGVGVGLTASGNSGGTSATLNGGTTFTVGANSVVLNITPSATTGDSTHPALNVSAGNLDLTGSTVTVANNSGSGLDVGDYTLITGGKVTGTLPALAPVVAGSGLAANTVASLQNTSGNLILHVVATGLPATTTSISLNSSWTSPSTYGDALTFDVAVTSGSGTPTGGTVTVKDGGFAGTTIGTGILVNGAVTITLTPLNALLPGTHTNIVAIYSADPNYLGSISTALTQLVNVKGVTISGAAANDKCYDGSTTATLRGTVVGVLPGDSVSVNPIGTFASSAVGNGIAVTGFSLTGISANNYTLTLQPSGVTANIVNTGIWTNPAGGLWGTAGNWLNGAIGSGSSNTASFNQVDITADTTVNMDSSRTINQLIFGNTDASPSANWIVDNYSTPANTLTLAGTTPTVTVNNLGANKSATISAAVTFSTGLVKAGTGTLVLSGTNTWTSQSSANTIISNGTLAITGPWVPTGTNTINSGATMILGGAAATSRSSQTTMFQGAGTLIVTNSISFPNNLNPAYGAITFDLSGGGLVWVTGGATVTGSANGKGYWTTNYSSLTVDAGSSIDFQAAAANINAYFVQFDALNGGGTIKGGWYAAPNNTVLVMGASNTSGNFSGSIADHGTNASLTLNKVGSGTQTLSGTNTFTGGTTISAGTLQIGSGMALGGTMPATVGVNQYPVLVGAGGTLDLNGQTFSNRVITLDGGSLVNNNSIAASLNGTSSTGVQLIICTNGGAGISGDATLAITGGGGSGAAATASLGVTTASFTLAAGGSYTNKPTIAVTGGTSAAISVVWSGSGTVASPWTVSSFTITQPGHAFAGTPAISVTGGGGYPTDNGTPASFVGNANNYTVVGTSVTSAGSGYTSIPTVTLSSSTGDGGFGGQVLLDNNLHLTADSTVGGSGNTTISENIVGPGGLTKIGSGTLILANDNTYTGNTVVSNGVLTLQTATTLSTNTSVYVNTSSGVLNLAFIGTDVVADLYINGVRQPNGVYGATTAPITGAGYLGVGVAAVTTPPTLNYTITGVAGSQHLNMNWTGSYKLQTQTNTISVGLSTNWHDYPSGGSSPISVPVNANAGSVFFRLAPLP